MSLLVCIPTAGTGSRLGEMTRYLNKSLVSVNNKPVISHLIEQFPVGTRYVIPLGHKRELVKEYLALAHPDRDFVFVDVDPFEGNGSGLGFTLLCCRNELQEPFIFISCDTLTRTIIPPPGHNWMAFAEETSLQSYRTVTVDPMSGTITSILEKGMSAEHQFAYIGLAGIYNHEMFWDAMVTGGECAVLAGESHGLRALLSVGIQGIQMEWFDTGIPEQLERTREAFRQVGSPNILEKANEAIWFVGNRVIKFSDDAGFIAGRVARAKELDGFVPKISSASRNMYSYEKAPGNVLSEVITLPLFEKLLNYSKQFWRPASLDKKSSLDFQSGCLAFYREKTFARVEQFYKTFSKSDNAHLINGRNIPRLDQLLGQLDWKWLSQGMPCRFHGDFHFENILYDSQQEVFTFLDWRQDFAGALDVGDIYYDLAKLNHGLIVCHELIAGDHYEATWEGNEIRYDLLRKHMLVECEKTMKNFLNKEGLDEQRVKILTALIYLNIAALHHYPYCFLLYGLGKEMLYDTLQS